MLVKAQERLTRDEKSLLNLVNPLMPNGVFNICCPRDCVSRHNGGTSVPPLNPSESIVLSKHYRL